MFCRDKSHNNLGPDSGNFLMVYSKVFVSFFTHIYTLYGNQSLNQLGRTFRS